MLTFYSVTIPLHSFAALWDEFTGHANEAAEHWAAIKNGPSDTFEAIKDRADAAANSITIFAASMRDALNASTPKSDTWQSEIQNIRQLDRAMEELGAQYTKLNARTMNLGGKEEMATALAAAQERIRLADMEFTELGERLSSQVKIFAITEQQKTQQLLAALDVRRAAEMAAIADELAIARQGTTEYQRVLNEKLTMEQKYQAERRKIQDQQLQSDFSEWQSELSAIQSAWKICR